MRKSVMAILLVVVMLFSAHYAISEGDTDRAKQIEDQDRQNKISRILSSGTGKVLPADGYVFFSAMDCQLELPEIVDEETAKQYIGSRYLLHGKAVDYPGGVCCFELDDGRIIHIDFNLFIKSPAKILEFSPLPAKGKELYVLCTFSHWSKYAEGNCNLMFVASVLQDVQDYIIDYYGGM